MMRLSIIGVPSSAGSYAAGQDQAPAALRNAGLVQALSDAGLLVRDHGDLPEQVWRPDRQRPFAQNAGQVTAGLQELADRLGPPLADGDTVLVLGGTCTIALAVINLSLAVCPGGQRSPLPTVLAGSRAVLCR